MAIPLISAVTNLSLAPARLAGRLLSAALNQGAGHAQPDAAVPRPAASPRPRAAAARRAAAKPLDDVTIARKVESSIFRGSGAAKGKVDVNVADGVVWLRGEVRTPVLIKRLAERAAAVPEVRQVENLLHLPRTPAPSRTDTPPSQQRTRRSKARPAERKISPGPVTAEAPAPSVAEPSPREVSARRAGRAPAPLGSIEGSSEEPTPAEENGPAAAHRGSRLKPETVKAEMHRRTDGPGSTER
jgi:hypothetical protein